MTTDSIKQQLLSLFQKSKKDRHRFLSNFLSSNIAAQIFSLRTAEERKWTQAKLAKEAGIAQPRIPSYEASDYGAFTVATLKKLAYAFDVALVVKFVSFHELADQIANETPGTQAISYAVPASYQSDFSLRIAEGGLIIGEVESPEDSQAQRITRTLKPQGIYAATTPQQGKQPLGAQEELNKDQYRELVST